MANILIGNNVVVSAAGSVIGTLNADSTVSRFNKGASSSTGFRVVAAASTFTSINVGFDTPFIQIGAAGVHGLTTATVVTAGVTNVYITWTGGKATSGFYPIKSVINTTVLELNLPSRFSQIITFTIPVANYSQATRYRAGDLMNYGSVLYVCIVPTSKGRVGPFWGGDFVPASNRNNGGIVNWTAHGLVIGDPIRFQEDNEMPPELNSGNNFYVARVLNADQFTVSATLGGAEIVITNEGSPTNTAYLYYGVPVVTKVATDINMVADPVEANRLTEKGSLQIDAIVTTQSSLNNKTVKLGFGTAGNLYSVASASNITSILRKIGFRRGADKFVTSATTVNGDTVGSTAVQVLTIDATAAQSFFITCQMATANEVVTLEGYRLEVD